MRLQDPLPEWTTHVALVHKDGTIETGIKKDVLSSNASILGHHLSSITIPIASSKAEENKDDEILVDLEDVSVAYGDRKASINLLVPARSHRLIGSQRYTLDYSC